jgi:hypothetical protein
LFFFRAKGPLFVMKGVLVLAAVAACATVEVAGFTVGVANFGLRRKTLAKNLCMQNDEINTKKVAGWECPTFMIQELSMPLHADDGILKYVF